MSHKQTIFLTLFLSIALFFGCTKKEELKIGKKAPSFSLIDINEKVHKLSNYEGKIVVLRFWEEGCPACLTEMPLLDKLYKDNKEKLVVLAVNMGDSADFIRGFAKEASIAYPMLIDKLKIATQKYKVFASPTTYIIDKQGVLRRKIMGESQKNTLQKIILGYL